MLDPLAAAHRIRTEYTGYLRSTFYLQDTALRQQFEAALDHDYTLARGPFLEASPPYVPGASLADLVRDGVLAERLLALTGAFPADRPLYAHQEQAVRRATTGRNLIVATGTGSGKTETFLLPILNHLAAEADAGTLDNPGVRALLLYPMNALANDQVKRLRHLLAALPEMTFGRYVGETLNTRRAALEAYRARNAGRDPVPNEMLSREEIQESPPHILLTNFAMLEYLLLRPDDSPIFDGPTSGQWRFMVLDEVHVYDGAKGTEIAMLLRRVRDRVVNSELGRIQCFGTSATLGRGEKDHPALVEFAESLFGERFEWIPGDPARQDVIAAQHRPLQQAATTRKLTADQLGALHRAYRSEPGGLTASSISAIAGTPVPGMESKSAESALRSLLEGDERVIALQEALERGVVDAGTIARQLFDEHAERRLVELIDLCLAARNHPDDAPLIPARYHFFLRSLDGAFLCLHARHPEDAPRLLLFRHEQCPACQEAGITSLMVEIGACRHCGAEYAIGKLNGTRLAQAGPRIPSAQLLLGATSGEPDEDDEDERIVWANPGDTQPQQSFLCPQCGALNAQGHCACDGSVTKRAVGVASLGTADQDGGIHRCPACARRSPGDIVRRFVTGSDAPVAVIATDLYQALPPASSPDAAQLPGEGRKLLAFSDSRQDAAFFAPYLERTYNRSLERRLLVSMIEGSKETEVWAPDLEGPLKLAAIDFRILDPDQSPTELLATVRRWITREILSMDTRLSLDGTGVAEVSFVPPQGIEPPEGLLALGLTPQEGVDIIAVLLGTLRTSGAVSPPEHVDLRDEMFAPRNRPMFVRQTGPAPGVLAWLPARGQNTRTDFLGKLIHQLEVNADPREILAGMWSHMTGEPRWQKVLAPESVREGVLYRLDYGRICFRPASLGREAFRCDRCFRVAWRSVRGICPQYRCDGRLAPLDEPKSAQHYVRRYRNLQPIAMRVQEHTAQWTAQAASMVQDEFVAGIVNVLSCSTTFELGVDVGEVQAVLLRNVPPSPANYIQRAGRAGRRTDSAALVVTFAQRRNHDANFFARPEEMIEGTITPPAILLDNLPIARRHVHAIAFAEFERKTTPHRTVSDFFLAKDDGVASENFVSWLRSRPETLGAALERTLPSTLRDALGVEEWAWVEQLAEESAIDPTYGWLERAAREVQGDLDSIQEAIDDLVRDRNLQRAAHFQRVQRTVEGKQLIGFLGSRNVLPKYGFPVDVVELDLDLGGDPVAGKLELTRDLRLAITEFAPGARIVAAKAIWEPLGLRTRADKELLEYGWGICQTCGTFRSGFGGVPPECECGEVATSTENIFVVPIWGFIGQRSKDTPGENRPARTNWSETYFSSYGGDLPPLQAVLDGKASARISRQGRIVVINRGPLGRGFRICTRCGCAEVPPLSGGSGRGAHTDIRRPNRQCEGRFVPRHLGHEFLTDLVELQFHVPMSEVEARSVLAALLESVPSIGINRADVDGTVATVGRDVQAIVLFDSVPGGAGHAQRIYRLLPDLAQAAYRRSAECSCGEETSCYGCLRSFSNQLWHEELARGLASGVLSGALPAT